MPCPVDPDPSLWCHTAVGASRAAAWRGLGVALTQVNPRRATYLAEQLLERLAAGGRAARV